MAAALASNTFSLNLEMDGGERDNAKLGLVLVAIVLLFLFTMVALKLCCNMMIDVMVLRDADSFMRTVSQLRRTLCPWWHPRTEASTLQHGNNASSLDLPPRSTGHSSDTLRIDIENLLVGMTPDQKKQLLASILPCKTVSEPDLSSRETTVSSSRSILERNNSIEKVQGGSSEKKSRDNSTNSIINNKNTNNALCPICIHDIRVGESICYSALCHHVFHRDCLSAWLSTHSRICPYCRQEILTQEMLEEAHRIKQEWLRNGNDDDSSYSSGEESDDSLDC
ncbi:ring finger domain containing protein [Nitzschia inconspicua]|uniref:Ring finger domain containing protein n=1 Tax=Nitzschia inconspicua TaxID=303405 RepID=A0A9K3K8J6_9STRA|nr:ring finger domain containing protein [Nitzschia inconspicua]KAG7365955.1 ring finger domain containing protein [Nitzschia inconspicua]